MQSKMSYNRKENSAEQDFSRVPSVETLFFNSFIHHFLLREYIIVTSVE